MELKRINLKVIFRLFRQTFRFRLWLMIVITVG